MYVVMQGCQDDIVSQSDSSAVYHLRECSLCVTQKINIDTETQHVQSE